MPGLSLASAMIALPQVRDPHWAVQAAEKLRERAAGVDDEVLRAWLEAAAADEQIGEVLGFVFHHSPFLAQCALRDPAFLKTLLEQGPDTCFTRILDTMKDTFARIRDADQLMRELRIARRRVALLTAIADIAGHWTLDRITHALSDFADGALSASVSHLLLEAAAAGEIALVDPVFPEDQCGYVVLAMGKHGGRELNYSSDIDLIVVYEPSLIDYRGRRSHQQFAVRLTQRLIVIMQQATADGYVARVDLNLRPDPGATPVAVGYAAAQTYYRNRGENWERAAMIKARPAAGDLGLGRQFLDEIAPFIWRDTMDFWMLQDMRAIKQRINAHKGGDAMTVAGHNVKLGRGGIREIEFYAQTQQLIYGGADPYLRCGRTVEALTTLAEAGHIGDVVADELTEAYEFLRQLEHRLQMVDDRQTQTMPGDDAGVAAIARFMAYDDADAFGADLLATLARVEAHYGRLFEATAGDEAGASWSFEAETPDAATAARFVALGFADADATYRRLARWHGGALRSCRSRRSHELMQQLIPDFVHAAAHMPRPDVALEALETFLARLPSALAILATISAHPSLLTLVVEIVTLAPALAGDLGRRTQRMQASLAAGFFDLLPDGRLLRAECAEIARVAQDVQNAVERMDVQVHDHRFQVAVNLLRHGVDAHDAGLALSDLNDAVVEQMGALVAGGVKDDDAAPFDRMAVVATGDWGRRELTLATPIELLFVHEADAAGTATASRLARRIVAICAARSAGGRLCAVETASPVWGAPGPLVTPFDAFVDHVRQSPTAEQLIALIEVRVVCGPADLRSRIEDALREALSSCVDPVPLVAHARKGISDIEAKGRDATPSGLNRCAGIRARLDDVVRALQVLHAAESPEILTPSVAKALTALAQHGVLDDDIVRRLLELRHRLRQVDAMMSVRFARSGAASRMPAEPDADLLRAAGMIEASEWRAYLSQGVATLCTIRDDHLR